MTEIFLPWVGILVCFNPPAQWSPVICAFIPSSCSSSFRAAVPSGFPSTLVRPLPFFVLLQRPSKGRNFLPKGSWPRFGPQQPFPNDPMIPEGAFNCRPASRQSPKLWLPKGASPGQYLTQNGRFPRIPEGEFSSRQRGRQMPQICFQKAPGQDLAQNGRFPRIPEGEFSSRPRGRQMPQICFQNAPGPVFGHVLGHKSCFPMLQ